MSEMVNSVASAMYVRSRAKREGPFAGLPGAEEAYREAWDAMPDANKQTWLEAAQAAIVAMKPFLDQQVKEARAEGYSYGRAAERAGQ